MYLFIISFGRYQNGNLMRNGNNKKRPFNPVEVKVKLRKVDNNKTFKSASELKISLKKVSNKHYFIGNCDLDINLLDTVIMFVPPKEGEKYGSLLINSSEEDNKQYGTREEEDDQHYFIGECDMDIGVINTVIKFIPPRYQDERNASLIFHNYSQEKQTFFEGHHSNNDVD